jgi:hypothetical protein
MLLCPAHTLPLPYLHAHVLILSLALMSLSAVGGMHGSWSATSAVQFLFCLLPSSSHCVFSCFCLRRRSVFCSLDAYPTGLLWLLAPRARHRWLPGLHDRCRWLPGLGTDPFAKSPPPPTVNLNRRAFPHYNSNMVLDSSVTASV